MRATCSLFLLVLVATVSAAPTMTTASLAYRHKEDKEKLTLFWDGTWLRIEQPSRRFGLLYREKDGQCIGLEERDAYYWKFNWLEISAALHKQQSGKSVLAQSLPGFPAASNLEKAPAAWLWHFDGGNGTEKTWEAAGEGTHTVEAKVPFREKPDPQAPAMLALWKRFARAADIVRLVAMRDVAPDGIDPLLISLPAEAGSPASLTWIEHGETLDVMAMNDFHAGAARDAARFAPPHDYREEDLETIKGILKEAPEPPKPITGEDLPPLNNGDQLMPTP